MTRVKLHFYKELNDFLAPAIRNTEIIHNFERNASVKDMIESFNVPHTEIEVILVNGVSVDFAYIVQDDDRIAVYPYRENIKANSLLRLRREPLLLPAFVVDANLGRLARYLRLLGLDCLYQNDYEDKIVAKVAYEQHRIVLTRDRKLLHCKIIEYGYFVRAVIPKIQIKEILERFNLYRFLEPMTRCTRCNGKLIETEKQQIGHRLQPLTNKYYDKFLVCSECEHIYWRGSHCIRVSHLVNELTEK